MKETPKEKKFMREKIVKPPVDKRRLVRRFLCLLLVAAVFGAVASVAFVISRPFAERYFGKEPEESSVPITIERDTEPGVTDETMVTLPEETSEALHPEDVREEVDKAVERAFEEFPWSVENIEGYQRMIQSIGQEADKGIVTVSSIRQEVDWFDNPVESAGQYAGAIVAINPNEIVVLTGAELVENADSLTVTFNDGSTAPGEPKQKDSVGEMAVVSVKMADVSETTLDRIKAFELGNSYMTRNGDITIAVGSPAGKVHSIANGTVTYIAKGVQVPDGQTRVLYTDIDCSVDSGTFLLNLSGELIGWATNRFRTEDSPAVTMATSISEYKWILQKLSNGISVPYFGIMGQDVSEAMQEEGMPRGIYITDSIAGGPAYDAGILNGDILTEIQGEEIASVREFQSRMEDRSSGETVAVTVQRWGIDEYRRIEYEVTIGER